VLEEVFRDEWGRVLASLVRYLGDFDRAEEAAQEAFAIAAERWPASGAPPNPGAWLVTTARNRAIDRIRRERTLAGKIQLLPEPETVMDEFDDTVIKDERLELIFSCCHPALPLDGQVALTLRALGGLETAEIARAFQALEQAQPPGVRYASSLLSDGVTFVALLELEDGGGHPLRGFPAYQEMVENLKQWYAEPPAVEQMTVTGSYGLF
jgi:RNA polymerase sigma factor (sigma-70 family)